MSLIEDDINLKQLQNEINISTSLDNSNSHLEEKYEMNNEDSHRRFIKEEETTLNININNSNNNKSTKSYLLYGNHIDNLHPKYLGRAKALFYINNYPLIIIGPDCKFIFCFILIFIFQRLL